MQQDRRAAAIIRLTLTAVTLASVDNNRVIATETTTPPPPPILNGWTTRGPALLTSGKNSLPVFYFEIIAPQGIDTSSLDVQVLVRGGDRPCRVWREVYNRGVGSTSWLVVMRMTRCCRDLDVDISVDGTNLPSIHVSGPFLTEWHNCPSATVEAWASDLGCPNAYEQIKDDLVPFVKEAPLEMKAVLMGLVDRVGESSSSYSFCHYRIASGHLWRRCYGQHTDFKLFPDGILLSLLRKVQLPDVDFLVNLGDYPISQHSKGALPIFSWCGSNDSFDIVWPTYQLTESILQSHVGEGIDVLSLQKYLSKRFSKRRTQAVWRGRDSREERLRLIEISRANPDLLSAAITHFFFFRDKEKLYGPPVQPLAFQEFFDYKWLINLDGTVAAYRLPFLLAGGSTVFKQDSPFYEYFYRLLQPWKHYVPIARDLSDTVEKLSWARDNEEDAANIGQSGARLVSSVLDPVNVLCYIVRLLQRWSDVSVQHPSSALDLGMDRVEQPPRTTTDCECADTDIPVHADSSFEFRATDEL